MERFKKILLVTVQGQGQKTAFERAVELANKSQGQLTILDLPDQIPEQKKNLLGKLFSKELDDEEFKDDI